MTAQAVTYRIPLGNETTICFLTNTAEYCSEVRTCVLVLFYVTFCSSLVLYHLILFLSFFFLILLLRLPLLSYPLLFWRLIHSIIISSTPFLPPPIPSFFPPLHSILFSYYVQLHSTPLSTLIRSFFLCNSTGHTTAREHDKTKDDAHPSRQSGLQHRGGDLRWPCGTHTQGEIGLCGVVVCSVV